MKLNAHSPLSKSGSSFLKTQSQNLINLVFVVAFLGLSNLGLAQYSFQREVPYYGEDFYRSLQNSTRDEGLKQVLKKVLRSYHIQKNGQLDKIVDDCSDKDGKCYAQISLGYDRARLVLMGTLHLTQDKEGYGVKEMYCDRVYGQKDFNGRNSPGPNKIPDNNILNTEHTWPQSRFSRSHPKDIQKSDLHHLYPTDTQLNSIRGNNKFGEVTRDRQSLKCNNSRFGVGSDGGNDIFEPPNSHKGKVARALFYFSVRYDLPISREEEAVLKKWHNEFPVEQEEIVRNNEVFKAQGNRNPFVDHPELVSSITDF